MVDEVGKDAVRFMMLYRKNDAVLDFDLAKVIEQSRDNPVFYVQYGHARGAFDFPQRPRGWCPEPAQRSIPTCRGDARAASLPEPRSNCSTTPAELALMKKIAAVPAPHRGCGAGP